MHFSLIATTFVIILLAELPDKTMISSVIMGSKLVPQRVLLGASAAFAIQVIIAVSIGGLVSRIPRRPLGLAIGIIFLIGAALIVRDMISEEAEREETLAKRASKEGFRSQVFLAFGVIFLAEFGDITQIAIANLAAKTGDPLSVGVGSFLGLLTITTLGIYFGSKVLSKVPIKPVQIISTFIMAGLGLFSILSVI
ncbi:MAG: TMEM165/GDT1 family protein [Acidimicrobiaceae bacterium]|nr:TMEM165/GDT1 family protein [Acidimicrobiaceae bacterium]